MLAETAAGVPVDRLLERAVVAYRSGKWGAAEVSCKEILKQQPEHIAGLQLLAAAAGQLGTPRRGIELMQKVIALQPERADAHVQLAKLLRQEHRTEEAIATLKTAIELEQENSGAHNDLGLIYLAEGKSTEALSCFDRAIGISPDLAVVHFNKGLALERHGVYDEAIGSFRQAISISADFAEAYAKLGNLLLSHGDEAEGLECLRKAAAAKPDSGIAFMCEAKLLIEDGKAAEAEAPLRRAIECDPQNSDAHALLGTVLLELGRFDDAGAAADLSVALNRHQVAAYHELVNVKRLSEADRPLVDHIEWMLGNSAPTEDACAHLHLSLGKAYDDLRGYDRAMHHFDEGNRRKHRRDAPYVPLKHAATVQRIIETFTADFFSRNAALGSDWDVPVLVMGMPRSGTTLVEQILSSHPRAAAGDELAFWGDRARNFAMDSSGRINPDWVESTARDYQELLRKISPSALRVTDKRPQNFNVIALIHAVFPCARILHCQRHPVDTCLSIYFQNFARKMDFAYDRADLAAYYVQYQRLMTHWRSVLSSDVFMEVQYEELVTNPEPVTRKMIEFCGLPWDDACLHHERNKRAVRTASVWQARQPVYQTSVARWRNYEPWLGPLRELLPDTDRMDTTTT